MKRKGETRVNTKKSVLLLLILLAFAILSTYAWFTSNRLVRITPIDVHIQASEGFQISLDAINWKTVIQASDITGAALASTYSNHRNHVPTDFDPISTAAETSTNGDMIMFEGQAAANDTENPAVANDNYLISAEAVTEGRDTSGFIGFDLFFRTNNVMTLALEQEANVVDNATEASRTGKGIENSARVGFVYQGHLIPGTPGTQAEVATLARALVYDTDRDGSNVTIWEPNYLTHTEETRTEMFNMFGIDTTAAEYDSRQEYDGIYAAIPAKVEDDPDTQEDESTTGTYLLQNNATENPDYFKDFSGEVAGIVTTQTDRNGSESLNIELQPGITKFRIYMWLEGQDWDCYDNASGSDIQWNLVITKVDTAIPPTP